MTQQQGDNLYQLNYMYLVVLEYSCLQPEVSKTYQSIESTLSVIGVVHDHSCFSNDHELIIIAFKH